MIKVRKAQDRGSANHGWLLAKHSFSFSSYYDPDHMGHGALRVMNEDRIAPGGAFGMHPHNDMEILTYIIKGALEHRDDMGNGSVIKSGDFQRMSAGTGIVHSEANASDEEIHLYQIWITPEAKGLSTGYEEKAREAFTFNDDIALVASRDGREGSMTIQQDAELSLGQFSTDRDVQLNFTRDHAWLQVVEGEMTWNDQNLQAGDGLALRDEQALSISVKAGSQALIFDLPHS